MITLALALALLIVTAISNRKLVFLQIILGLLVVVSLVFNTMTPVKGQDDPFPTLTPTAQPVMAMIVPVCLEAINDNHARLHFGYYADGVDHFVLEMATNAPTATLNYAEFTSDPGHLVDYFYIDMQAQDTPHEFLIRVTGDLGSTETTVLSVWTTVAVCDLGQYPLDPNETSVPTLNFNELHPTSTPTPEYNQEQGQTVRAWDSGRGVWYFPIVTSNGVIKLPNPMN